MIVEILNLPTSAPWSRSGTSWATSPASSTAPRLMSYAGSVERVDARGERFCADCFRRLPTWLSGGSVRVPAT